MKPSTGSLFDATGRRKYLTAEERQRFMAALTKVTAAEALFCQTLLLTGCRLSEVLALQRHHLSAAEQCIFVRSLKERGAILYRRVPVPRSLIIALLKFAAGENQQIWPMGRTAAWACVKRVMTIAQISGPHACPRGLRHTFGVHAIQSGIPLHLVQRWLGHARMETTAIYTNAIGDEELVIARRMWRR